MSLERVHAVDLQRWVALRDAQEGRAAPCHLRQYRAALYVLGVFLGDEWAKERTFRGHRSSKFLNPQRVEWDDGFKHQDRVVALAEMLFNFQDVRGIAERVKALQTRDVETGLGELEGARLLFQSGIPFHFIQETGVTGQDYDVEIEYGGRTVPGEMKCKIESAEPSTQTVVASLKKARRQLPPGETGVVFLKVPAQWPKQPNSSAVTDALSQVFRNTGRIGVVFLHWEEWIKREPGGAVRLTKFRPEANKNARVRLDGLADLMLAYEPTAPAARWVDFAQVVCTT